MLHFKLLLLVCVAMSLACNGLVVPTATPAPIPTVVSTFEIPSATVEYYDIRGSTEWEMREQLNTKSLVDDHGYRGDALTSWDIRWTWDGYGTEACDLSTVHVSYDIKVQMPRWTSPPQASAELITKWNAYIHALVEHEKGHVDNVLEFFPEVARVIRESTCTTAEANAQEVLSQLRGADLQYDEATNHGATQGAVFP